MRSTCCTSSARPLWWFERPGVAAERAALSDPAIARRPRVSVRAAGYDESGCERGAIEGCERLGRRGPPLELARAREDRHLVDIDATDEGRPTLKKRQPGDATDPASGDGESSSDGGPPKLKKKTDPAPTPTPTI